MMFTKQIGSKKVERSHKSKLCSLVNSLKSPVYRRCSELASEIQVHEAAALATAK